MICQIVASPVVVIRFSNLVFYCLFCEIHNLAFCLVSRRQGIPLEHHCLVEGLRNIPANSAHLHSQASHRLPRESYPSVSQLSSHSPLLNSLGIPLSCLLPSPQPAKERQASSQRNQVSKLLQPALTCLLLFGRNPHKALVGTAAFRCSEILILWFPHFLLINCF